MEISIEPMTTSHFISIKENLTTQFDDFWTASILEKELQNPNSHYFIAVRYGVVLGFAGIWKAVDEYHITDIVVKKDLRQKGIGSQLLEKLIEVAKSDEVTAITLEVNCHNTPAIALYEKYYFQTVGTRKKYYHNTDDALIMTLFLN